MTGLLPFKQIDPSQVTLRMMTAESQVPSLLQSEIFKRCFSCLDLTSLGVLDSVMSVREIAQKTADFKIHFPDVPQVAAICVYPELVEVAGLVLGESEVAIAAAAGGFPSSHSFLEVKMLECAMAEENGADEIDMVMNLGEFRDGNNEVVAGEIKTIRGELDAETRLKVIIESGLMPSLSDVY
ncbi:MAG: deoxyribose-phosphate aldolase, partial [Rikenellaceae bacterium]|nr:deoxyribose-phosphate aldolase [Rikenellaceae bacterium]